MKKKKRGVDVDDNDNDAEELPYAQVIEPQPTMFLSRSKIKTKLDKSHKNIIKPFCHTILDWVTNLLVMKMKLIQTNMTKTIIKMMKIRITQNNKIN